MTWSDIFWKYVRRGEDRCAAAFMADNWERRQKPNWARCPSTHCERRQECASPNGCTVEGKG